MKRKAISLGIEARKKSMEGVNYLADAMESTMGPYGNNFLVEKGDKMTNDGKIIAAEMEHDNEISNRALSYMRKAGIATEEEVGDASSSAVSLGRAIMKEVAKQLPNETIVVGKMTTGEVVKKVEEERLYIEEKLNEMATPITSVDQLISAVKVCTENQELAEVIATAQWELGKEAILIAEDTIGSKTYVEKVNGILLDNGLSTSLVMNNFEKQSLEVRNVRVLLTNHVITDFLILNPLIQAMSREGIRSLVVIARAFSENAINAAMEYAKAGINIYPVNAPYVDQNEIMKDLEAVLGGKCLFVEDSSLVDIELSSLGFAENINVERYRAIFAGTKSDEAQTRIDKRIEEITSKLNGNVSVFEKKNLQRRISQLTVGFGIVHVGAESEDTRKRLKDKADDAVVTVRIAMQEGVVKGGGLAFKEISDGMPEGFILKNAIRCINNVIMNSAPVDFKIEDWVVDPVKTLKVALKHASHRAVNLATGGGVIATKRDKPRYVQEVAGGDNE